MNNASEFSPHALGGKPSRTAKVSRRASRGSRVRGSFLSFIVRSGAVGRAVQRQARALRVLVFVHVATTRTADGLGHVAGDVVTVEAGRLEAIELGVQRLDHALHRVDV